MKKAIEIITLVMILHTGASAFDVSKKQDIQRETSTSSELEVLQQKIAYFTKYLNDLPIEIQETIGILEDKKAEGNKAQSMVIRLLSNLDRCMTKELDPVSEEMCRLLSNQSVGSIIKKEQEKIKNAITFIGNKLKDLNKKNGNKEIIQDGITTLENARDILLGVK